MGSFSLNTVKECVGSGKAVISADDSAVLGAVQNALETSRSVTFYLSQAQAAVVRAWYWTPARIEELGMESVSLEERERIQSLTGVDNTRAMYSNRITCECGSVYGALEFVQQGIEEHGKDAVAEVFKEGDVHILRINPGNTATCPDCRAWLLGSHNYAMADYSCIRSSQQ